MAKRRPAPRTKRAKTTRKAAGKPHRRQRPPARRRRAVVRTSTAARTKAVQPPKSPRLDRERRRLEDGIPTPPSSLDLDRHGSAVRTGREEMAQARRAHATMTPAITGGDVDANVENAYFSGDEAPGGDNSTPDQDIVDNIGKALGVEYNDAEELGGDKLTGRDKHRWELDPASSDDYKDRK